MDAPKFCQNVDKVEGRLTQQNPHTNVHSLVIPVIAPIKGWLREHLMAAFLPTNGSHRKKVLDRELRTG